jgi:hypothetical protein
MSYQRYDNFLVREDLGELDHPPEILLGEAAAEFPLQPAGQRRDDPLAVPRPFLVQDLPPDAVTHLPIQQREPVEGVLLKIDRPELGALPCDPGRPRARRAGVMDRHCRTTPPSLRSGTPPRRGGEKGAR